MAARPLRLEELADVLAFDFEDAPGGVPQLNADWRREDQERAVLSICSSLITIVHDHDSRVVQFSHFSVKEFLTSDRLAAAAEGISFHHIVFEPAHTILAQACVAVLLRLDDSSREASIERFPLAEYALEHWVKHAQFENVSLQIKDGIEDLFDAEKPHLWRWMRVRGNMDKMFPWIDATRPEQPEAAPIYRAAHCGWHNVVMHEVIMRNPTHVNALGGSYGMAIHAASRRDHLKVIQLLLRYGADLNAPGLWGRTPLLFASEWGSLELVRWLLEHGADVNAKDKMDGGTSLHLAVERGDFEIVRTLLKHHADTNARRYNRFTSLHDASGGTRVDMVQLLLNHGTDPNASEMDQETSLHRASPSDTARLLLEQGADLGAEDNQGRTAYQFALDGGHDEIAQLLLMHGAKST